MKNRQFVRFVASFLVVFAVTGCGKKSPGRKMADHMEKSTKNLNDMCDIMAKITDAASFETQKPRLKKCLDQERAEWKKIADENPSGKTPDITESDPEYKRLKEAQEAHMQAHERLVRDGEHCYRIPGFIKWWSAEWRQLTEEVGTNMGFLPGK